uniref:Putative RNA polymerase II-associated protein 3 isoform X1 n=1 Tax=Davidia involucrata TaxID=16924 RepID=A0A5B6ZTR7_DAVIN
MARVPSKHARDQPLDWEVSLKDKDKKLKPQALAKQKLDLPTQRGSVNNASQLSSSPGVSGRQGQSKEHGSGSSLVSSSQKIGTVGEDRRPVGKTRAVDYSSTARQYDYSRNYDSISKLSSGFMTEENYPDATSEKELGNEYFKQKKFNEAIDCYSRSIALSPTAVAYANRAMAYLKIKRFQEAEDDCTEALNLDDRYIKAYSRRATARKELGKLKESIEDAEFALRLEPQNQEIKKQHAEAKSLYEKEILKKASGALKSSIKGVQNAGKSKAVVNGHVQHIQPVSSGSQSTGVAPIQEDSAKDNGQSPMDTLMSMKELESNNMRTKGQEVDGSHEGAIQSSGLENVKRNHRTHKQELLASVQELASRAASRAKSEAARNITPPNSAYQFEVSWRGLSGDRALQARLLKATSPLALPLIFKNALSAPILIDIIKCIATFFSEEMDLAVKYLENLTKVARFDMIIMCLASTDKADLLKIWDEIFCNKATPTKYSEMLDKLRSRYCVKK